mgnify:CR=1 FL=1
MDSGSFTPPPLEDADVLGGRGDIPLGIHLGFTTLGYLAGIDSIVPTGYPLATLRSAGVATGIRKRIDNGDVYLAVKIRLKRIMISGSAEFDRLFDRIRFDRDRHGFMIRFTIETASLTNHQNQPS